MAKRRKQKQPSARKAPRPTAAAPDVRVWRICKWKALYAAAVERGSEAERYATMYPMQYVRLWCGQATVEGNYVDIQLAAIRAAGGLELLGIAMQLLRMAASRDRFGGRLVDHLGQPASPREIAEAVGVMSLQRMHIALRTLSGPRIAFVEAVPFDQVGTPIAARTAARDAHANPRGDGRGDAPGSNTATAGDRESRQAGGLASGTASSTAAAPPDGAPADGLSGSCGPPGEGGSGGDENRGGTPKEQEQEQEKGQEAGQGQESAAPIEKKKIGMPEGTDPQAQACEAQSTGMGTGMGMSTSTSTGMGQPIADVPMAPTGADPGAPGEQQTTAAGGVDEAAAQARHVDALTLAVYERIYPTAQFESVEMLKADSGRGLSTRQFRAREQGALAGAISKASRGMTAAQRSDLWAWAIATADSVYAKDHRKRRKKPLASVWIWRLNQHRRGGRRDAAGSSGPP